MFVKLSLSQRMTAGVDPVHLLNAEQQAAANLRPSLPTWAVNRLLLSTCTVHPSLPFSINYRVQKPRFYHAMEGWKAEWSY